MGTVDRGPIIAAGSQCPDDSGWLLSIAGLTDIAITRLSPSQAFPTGRGRRPQAAAGRARKSSWRVINAHPMRAILLAKATATSLRGLVASSLASQGSF